MHAGKTRQMPGKTRQKRGHASPPPTEQIARDTAGTFGHNQVRCNRPGCGNLASACAAGECWTCQAKRYEAQR